MDYYVYFILPLFHFANYVNSVKFVKKGVIDKHKTDDIAKKLEKILKTKQKIKHVDLQDLQHTRPCDCFVENLFPISIKEKKRCERKIADSKKKIEKFSKIKQKVKQIKSRYKRSRTDPVRNTFAINSLGALIVTSTIIYIYIAGILSLFFSESEFHFMREMMRILECISISIVSYFFGGIFSRTDKNLDDVE